MSLIFLSGPTTKTLRTVWLSAAVRFDASPFALAGSMPQAFRNAQVWVSDHRVVRRETLGLLDVFRPRRMTIERVDGKPDNFHVAPVKLGLELGHVAQLGGAHRREVLGMRKQHGPGIADPVMEADAAFRRLGLEVRRDVVDLE